MASLIKNAWNKLQYKAFKATYDPDANKYVAEQVKAAELPNTLAWNNYKEEWGRRAVDSKQINSVYFESYKSIMAIPAPPNSATEQEYTIAASGLASAIKAWYVNAKYKGDLAILALQIDETKPKWVNQGAAVATATSQPKPKPKPKTPTQLFITSFSSTFFSIIIFVILFFLCLIAGILAANDAIGRSPAFRIINFLYAAFPLFSPFVLIYYIYRAYKGTYPLYYNMIPLTTSPGENIFTRFFKKPFYYVPDKNSKFQADEIIRLGLKLVFISEPVAKANNETPATA